MSSDQRGWPATRLRCCRLALPCGHWFAGIAIQAATATTTPAADDQQSGFWWRSFGGNWSDHSYKKNPTRDSMASNITNQVNDNWSRNLAPSIRSGAMQTAVVIASGCGRGQCAEDVNSGPDQCADQHVRPGLLDIHGAQPAALSGRSILRSRVAQQRSCPPIWNFQINQGNVNVQLAGANLGMNTWGNATAGQSGRHHGGPQHPNTPSTTGLTSTQRRTT